MRKSLKEPMVILFALIACGPLFLLQFEVLGIGSAPDDALAANVNILGGDVALGKPQSSRVPQSFTWNAATAELRLAADDEKDDGGGAKDGKDETEGPDRLWDSAMLG